MIRQIIVLENRSWLSEQVAISFAISGQDNFRVRRTTSCEELMALLTASDDPSLHMNIALILIDLFRETNFSAYLYLLQYLKYHRYKQPKIPMAFVSALDEQDKDRKKITAECGKFKKVIIIPEAKFNLKYIFDIFAITSLGGISGFVLPQ